MIAGAVSEFWSGGCEMASTPSRIFLAPPCRGVPTINLQTYKQRADALLIVIYHLLKI